MLNYLFIMNTLEVIVMRRRDGLILVKPLLDYLLLCVYVRDFRGAFMFDELLSHVELSLYG
jgi:hypothetical protein